MSKHNTTTTTVPSDMTSTDHELLCLDMTAEYRSDRAHFPSRLSNELRDQILHDGPWRPIGPFPVNEEFGRRKFSENNYHVKSAPGCIKIERLWLCFFCCRWVNHTVKTVGCLATILSCKKDGLTGCWGIQRITVIRQSHVRKQQCIVLHAVLLHSGRQSCK